MRLLIFGNALFWLIFIFNFPFYYAASSDFKIEDQDINYLFTNFYFKAFSEEFNECMFQVERNHSYYHTCEGFKSDVSCQCSFLRLVDQECRSKDSTNNYWYLEDSIESTCSESERILNELRESDLSQNSDQANNASKSDIGSSMIADQGAKVQTKPQNVKRSITDNSVNKEDEFSWNSYDTEDNISYNLKEDALKAHEHRQEAQMESSNPLVYNNLEFRNHKEHLQLSKYYDIDLNTIDFDKIYKKEQPSAMTVDCQLMEALKLKPSPTDKYFMTLVTSTFLAKNSFETHHTTMEIIKVYNFNDNNEGGNAVGSRQY